MDLKSSLIDLEAWKQATRGKQAKAVQPERLSEKTVIKLLLLQQRRRNMYTEKHHIIPRCLGGTDDGWNLVELTYEEHVEAHLILYILNRSHRGLKSSYLMMVGETEEARRLIVSMGGKSSKPTLEVHVAGGKAQGRRNVESGQLASVRPNFDVEHQRKASARASRKVVALEDPSVVSSWNQRKATEKRLGRTFTWVDK